MQFLSKNFSMAVTLPVHSSRLLYVVKCLCWNIFVGRWPYEKFSTWKFFQQNFHITKISQFTVFGKLVHNHRILIVMYTISSCMKLCWSMNFHHSSNRIVDPTYVAEFLLTQLCRRKATALFANSSVWLGRDIAASSLFHQSKNIWSTDISTAIQLSSSVYKTLKRESQFLNTATVKRVENLNYMILISSLLCTL